VSCGRPAANVRAGCVCTLNNATDPARPALASVSLHLAARPCDSVLGVLTRDHAFAERRQQYWLYKQTVSKRRGRVSLRDIEWPPAEVRSVEPVEPSL